MRSGSGGMGKTEDSTRARRANAWRPYGVSAQCRTQLYSRRTHPDPLMGRAAARSSEAGWGQVASPDASEAHAKRPRSGTKVHSP